MLSLYTTPVSANGRKPLALARHLTLDVEVHDVNVYLGQGQTAGYRVLNPWGKVPTLVDGDLTLWESNAILVYLAEGYGEYTLSSRDPKRRANTLRWLFWEASQFQPVLTRVLAPRAGQVLTGGTGSELQSAWDDRELVAVLTGLESLLTTHDFVCGNALSVADFAMAGMTTYFEMTRFPSAYYPAISSWRACMDELPAWASTATEPWLR